MSLGSFFETGFRFLEDRESGFCFLEILGTDFSLLSFCGLPAEISPLRS